MSGPVEGTAVATGIIGTNNFVQVIGDFNVIGQQTNQCTLTSISPREIWFEVRKPVESFTGRRKELENLHKEVQRNLGKDEHKLTVISQVTSISGLGGIGKTELARMYAHEHGQEYDSNVIWINAETYETLKESFHRLAKDKLNISTKNVDGQEKNINSIIHEVYKYFAKRKSLFIFDNAEKLRTEVTERQKKKRKEDEGIDKFLPYFQSKEDNEPYIIITSRNQEWGDKIKVLPIDTFTEEEAIEFIKKELHLSDESQGKEISQLAKTLQYFPLALQQAVSYIKHTDEKLKKAINEKFEIIDYLKRYEENARKLLNFKFPKDSSNSYIKTTFITWEVTVEKIKQNKYGQQALEVLETIAYFAADNIPTKIFLKLAMNKKEKLGSILQLPAQYSMVNLEQGVLNIHRLVQQVIRLKLKEQLKEQEALEKALKLLNTLIEEEDIDSSKYLIHAISVWNYASNYFNRTLTKELIEFSSRIIYKLLNDTKYQEAYTFAIQILKLLKDNLVIGNPSTSNIEYLTLVPGNEDKYEVFEEVSKLSERVLGAEHPSTLLTKYNVASMLYMWGKYDGALKIWQEVFNIQERVLGGGHLDTLTTRHNTASVLIYQGRYDEALGIYQEVSRIQERVLGREHPSTLRTTRNMATVLVYQGRFDEALGIYQEVFNILERILGREHPDTLNTSRNMALALEKLGKYDMALGIIREVFNIQERVLGREHQNTLFAGCCMALVLDNQGKYDEALGIYKEMLKIQERLLGREHQDTLITRHNMASVLGDQGKYDEALGIYQEVLKLKERLLGGENRDTLITRRNIASVLDNQGKYDEALGICQEVLKLQERVLGGEHRDTLITRRNMASVLDNQGKYDEALGIYQEVFMKIERVLGKENRDTLITRHNIASVLDNQGKYDEALGIYQEVLKIQERVLGGEHPDTLRTRHSMASLLDKQGKYNEALEIFQEVFSIRERVLGGEHPDTLRTMDRLTSTKRASIR